MRVLGSKPNIALISFRNIITFPRVATKRVELEEAYAHHVVRMAGVRYLLCLDQTDSP